MASMTLLIYIAIGIIAGLMSGILGVGGGVIIVPALAWAFHYQALPTDHLFHLAVGTSLAIMVPTTISSASAHIRQGNVKWRLVERLLPGLLIGVVCGAALANSLPRVILQNVFALFILYVAIRMLLSLRSKGQELTLSRPFLLLMTILIGAVSGLLGIGVGSLGIPFLIRQNTPMRNASATIVTCTTPIAFCGPASFMIAGWHTLTLHYSSGYLYWPAFAGVSIASIIMAPIGAKLSRHIHTIWLKRLFALFVFAVSISLFLGQS